MPTNRRSPASPAHLRPLAALTDGYDVIDQNKVRSGTASRALHEARRRAGLSQTELARSAGVTQSVISAYESGARQPSLPVLEKLVAATGLELELRIRRSPPTLDRLTGPLGR